ncbi:Uncharacterised protein [Acinetobacter baumannii]|nr:Uncharacterised protein [Acinetobacter baumannii]
MPCCMQKVKIEISVDCLSPAGRDETVNPAANFPLKLCFFHNGPVASMSCFNLEDTPPK